MRRWTLPLAVAVVLAAPLAAADPPDKPKSYQIPYRLTETKHVLVRVKLNGKGPFNFILDTGAPAVFLSKAVGEKAGLKQNDDGLSDITTLEVEGGLKVPDARGRVEDLFQLRGMNGLGLAGVELHGVIGYNVLAKYRITYDFSADKLTWVPLDFDPPPLKRIGGKGGQGGLEVLGPVMEVLARFMGVKPNFDIKPRGFLGVEVDETPEGVVVKAVLPESPAAKAGLKVGDKIDTAAFAPAGGGKPDVRTVTTVRDITRALGEGRSGDDAVFGLKRDGKPQSVTVPFGKGL